MKIRAIFYCFLLVALILPAFGPGGVQPVRAGRPADDLGGEGLAPLAQAAAAAEPALAQPFLSGPSFDSGWLAVGPGNVITVSHFLNTAPELIYVDLQGRTQAENSPHTLSAGGADLGPSGERAGAFWFDLTENEIKIERRPEDSAWERVRLRLWRMSQPADYSSGWTALTAGVARLFSHNLGGTQADLVVSLVFRAPAPYGVNAAGWGGLDEGARAAAPGSRVGAYWYDLQATSIKVLRLPEDNYAPEVLVRVWKRPAPTYDSGWQTLDPGQALSFGHGIGGPVEDMLVDVQYQSAEAGIGVNQVYAGGNQVGEQPLFAALQAGDGVGAAWRSLDASALVVERGAKDIFAGQVRVRVWNFWTPRLANFDSGWVSLAAGQKQALEHGLGGDAQTYLVDLQFKSAAYGIGQRGLGGMYNLYYEEIGGAWEDLNDQSVSVVRNSEDNILDAARLRLWVMPRPDFDSTWAEIGEGQTLSFAHNLGGSPEDYLVDVEFVGPEHGTSQAGYGGYDVIDPGSVHQGENQGAAWHNLTSTSIKVTRQAEDDQLSGVRVRIWRMAVPDYRNWFTQARGDLVVYSHGLGQPAERYFVNLLFKNTTGFGLNQLYYGGAFFGTHPPAGYTEGNSAGGYYRALAANTISVFRMEDDSSLQQAQLRLWAPPYVKTYLALLR